MKLEINTDDIQLERIVKKIYLDVLAVKTSGYDIKLYEKKTNGKPDGCGLAFVGLDGDNAIIELWR